MGRLRIAAVTLAMAGLAIGAQPLPVSENPDFEQILRLALGPAPVADLEAQVGAILEAKPGLVEARDSWGPLLLHAVDSLSLGGDTARRARRLAELLLAKGADPNDVDANGEPLLVHYAMLVRVTPMQFLLAHGARPDVQGKEEGRTALHWAAILEEYEPDGTFDAEMTRRATGAAQALLGAGAPIDAADRRGVTPLGGAALLGNLNMVKLLVERGANVNARGLDGATVLGRVLAQIEKAGTPGSGSAAVQRVADYLRQHGATDGRPTR
ncbi:MAG: ankyrin repeat domain-containing protein [Thermoanaerobaculaceae bacterium]|jgi:ankyrin repeat protein|nr:ankyrin repeat domain-containing protein [Thermoanaerobaculaceae bacterium]